MDYCRQMYDRGERGQKLKYMFGVYNVVHSMEETIRIVKERQQTCRFEAP